MFGLKETKYDKKITSDIFVLFVFATENLSQTCLYEAERRERVRRILTGSPAERKTRGCTLLACVCACMSACVSVLMGNLWTHSLGQSSFSLFYGEMYKCCVDLQRKKKLADVLVLTREWKNCPYPCDCCSIQRCLKQQRRPSQASTDRSSCQES